MAFHPFSVNLHYTLVTPHLKFLNTLPKISNKLSPLHIINRTLSTQDLQTLCTASKRLAWVVGDCNYLPEISKRLKLKRQVTGITQAFQTPQTLHSPCPASYTHCHSVSRSAHKKTLKFGKH